MAPDVVVVRHAGPWALVAHSSMSNTLLPLNIRGKQADESKKETLGLTQNRYANS